MFGMLICETVTGRVPFADLQPVAAAHQIMSGQRPARPAHVDDALWALAERCWAHGANNRPKMAEVVAALDAAAVAGSPPAGAAAQRQPPAAPVPADASVLSVLLTRPYAPFVKRDVAECLTWPGLKDLLTEELLPELVAVEGRAKVLGVLADLRHLVQQYGH
jgi:hypothetical protein